MEKLLEREIPWADKAAAFMALKKTAAQEKTAGIQIPVKYITPLAVGGGAVGMGLMGYLANRPRKSRQMFSDMERETRGQLHAHQLGIDPETAKADKLHDLKTRYLKEKLRGHEAVKKHPLPASLLYAAAGAGLGLLAARELKGASLLQMATKPFVKGASSSERLALLKQAQERRRGLWELIGATSGLDKEASSVQSLEKVASGGEITEGEFLSACTLLDLTPSVMEKVAGKYELDKAFLLQNVIDLELEKTAGIGSLAAKGLSSLSKGLTKVKRFVRPPKMPTSTTGHEAVRFGHTPAHALGTSPYGRKAQKRILKKHMKDPGPGGMQAEITNRGPWGATKAERGMAATDVRQFGPHARPGDSLLQARESRRQAAALQGHAGVMQTDASIQAARTARRAEAAAQRAAAGRNAANPNAARMAAKAERGAAVAPKPRPVTPQPTAKATAPAPAGVPGNVVGTTKPSVQAAPPGTAPGPGGVPQTAPQAAAAGATPTGTLPPPVAPGAAAAPPVAVPAPAPAAVAPAMTPEAAMMGNAATGQAAVNPLTGAVIPPQLTLAQQIAQSGMAQRMMPGLTPAQVQAMTPWLLAGGAGVGAAGVGTGALIS